MYMYVPWCKTRKNIFHFTTFLQFVWLFFYCVYVEKNSYGRTQLSNTLVLRTSELFIARIEKFNHQKSEPSGWAWHDLFSNESKVINSFDSESYMICFFCCSWSSKAARTKTVQNHSMRCKLVFKSYISLVMKSTREFEFRVGSMRRKYECCDSSNNSVCSCLRIREMHRTFRQFGYSSMRFFFLFKVGYVSLSTANPSDSYKSNHDIPNMNL